MSPETEKVLRMVCSRREIAEIYRSEDIRTLIYIVHLLIFALEADQILFEEAGNPERAIEIDGLIDNVADVAKKFIALEKAMELAQSDANITAKIAAEPPLVYAN